MIARAQSQAKHLCSPSESFFSMADHFAGIVRRSSRVRFFSIAGVSNEMCGISQRCSAMNQIGFSVVIQLRPSNRARFTGREYRRSVRSPRRLK